MSEAVKNNETKAATATETASMNTDDVLKMHSKSALLNVICLELKPSSSTEDEDNEPTALYRYPKNGYPLFGIEGIFLVLSHALEDMTDRPTKCTTLHSAQGLTFRVGYYKEEKNLMAFAVSKERICCQEVCSLMGCILRLIQLLYGSLNTAVRKKKCHRKLDKMFDSVKHILIQNDEKFLMPLLNYIPFLPLPKVIQLKFDEILGSLGLADFSSQNSENLHQQNLLDVVGSCLVCNGYVLCNHLSPRHLEDVYLYLKFNQLLESHSSKGDQQIILWREIFPTESLNQKEMPLGYVEPNSRYFLQVVASENQILCILLRGLKTKVFSEAKTLTPPLFYIDQLRNLLQKLESVIQVFVEKSEIFAKEKNISLSNVQSSLREQFASLLKTPPIPFSNSSFSKSFQNKTEIPQNEIPQNKISKDMGVFNLTIQSPNSSDTVLLHSGILPSDSKFRNLSGSFTDRFDKQRNNKLLLGPNTSISQNFSKTDAMLDIFKTPEYSNLIPIHNLAPSYHRIIVILHLQAGQENVDKGVRINGSFQHDSGLISEFKWCCSRIKDHFDRADQSPQQQSDKQIAVAFPHIKEYGVLLRHDSKKEAKSKKVENPDYWVVGRQVRRDPNLKQQVFVCFLDGTPQNLIELAFCIPFGHDWTV